jgi:hypothetical protein
MPPTARRPQCGFSARAVLFNEGIGECALTLIHGSVELFSDLGRRSQSPSFGHQPFLLTSIADDLNPMAARTLDRSELLLVR